MRTRCLAGIAGALLVAGPAVASCPAPGEGAAGRPVGRDCPAPAAKLEPYDPDRLKAGRRPGFIDFGDGTQVRIGGRARAEFDAKR